MTRILAALAVLAALSPSPGLAEDAPYGFDLPKAYPAAYKALRAIVPPKVASEEWAGDMKGTSVPMDRPEGPGGPLAGFVCEPHDCLDNKLAFIVDPAGSRAVGLLRTQSYEGGKVTVLGEPTAAELLSLRGQLGVRD